MITLLFVFYFSPPAICKLLSVLCYPILFILHTCQDGRNILRCVLWKPQQQGEDLHGVCVDAEGDGAGCPWPRVPGQLHQVREGGVAAHGGGDPHLGGPVHTDHGSSRGGLYSRNDRNKSDFIEKETLNN